MTGRFPPLRALAELVRAPAAFTVPGDSLAGAAAAGWPFGPRTPAIAASSVCLYLAGMALNDYADREIDATERPERPIPSGRVQPGFALGLAAALTVAGTGIAYAAGGRAAVTVAAPLAATVWAYDLWLKSTPAGPLAMAAARTLDVLLGAGAQRIGPALPAAAAVGAHTLAVTLLSRGEVTGTNGGLAVVTLGISSLAAAGSAVLPAASGTTPRARRALTCGLLAGYLATFGRAQLAAARDPAAPVVRHAVVAGILSLMLLQGALASRAGALRTAVAIAAAFPLSRRLAGQVSPT
jgi:UbiA prenyltransferase family